MNRSSQHRAIILRISPSGDSNASVELLTPDEGLIRALAYGLRARRSSLRGQVVPFARGTVWLYRDPRRENAKITDFAVETYAHAIQADLRAYYQLSLVAEVVWRSHASGDGAVESYGLVAETLDLLDREDSPRPEAWYRRLTIQVLWRYLAVLGLQPDLRASGRSGREFGATELRFFDVRESITVESEWADERMLTLPAGAVRFLEYGEGRSLEEAVAVDLSTKALAALRAVILATIQEAIHVPLNTLRVAGGWI